MGDFDGAGKVPGFELWRIENMKPVKQPEMDGKLYSGDSYILLATTQPKTALVWHIHFWLGEETSQDESGVAAYKTVELDDYLGGAPIQHRECQGHESDLFMSYFKTTGLEYLKGGVDSGFNKVERDVWRTRLLQCKGKRSVRCTEVECVAANLNTGDVFILDMGLELYMYCGKDANKYEKAKGADMVHKIHNERGARGNITYLDNEPNCEAFWGALGGQIEVTNPGEDDEKASAASLNDVKLWHVKDDTGTLEMTEVQRNDKGQFTRDMLDSGDAYILDTGDNLYVWIGKGSSKGERKESMHVAQKFIADQGRPKHTQVERLLETGESVMFKSFFYQFDPIMTVTAMKEATVNTSHVAGKVEEKVIDMKSMHSGGEQEKMADDGSGKVEIWRIEDFKKVPVPPATYGQFYGGDSYIILYSYKDKLGREAWIIYFWQGRESTKDEIGASALLAKELDDSMGGAPVQVRVVQGKEPLHFRALFKGSMVIHEGGKAAGFKNVKAEDSYDTDGIALFHVKGTNALDVVGVQTKEVAASLNSMDAFVLVTPTTVHCWQGKGSNDDEKVSAMKIAEMLKTHSFDGQAPPAREVVAVAEGSESEEFWAALGGKGEYAEAPEGEPLPSDPRLFHCTDRFGAFEVEEIHNFTQEDMMDDDVMMLDCGTAVYIWIGFEANETERSKAMEVAHNYINTATDGRDPDVPIMQVSSGKEPIMFTQWFVDWDPEFFEKNKFVDPYEAKLRAAAAAKAAEQGLPPPAPEPRRRASSVLNPIGGFKDPATTNFSYEELSTGIPEGVNPTAKEQYLTDEVFQEKFEMTKDEFNKLPDWKRKFKKEKNKLW